MPAQTAFAKRNIHAVCSILSNIPTKWEYCLRKLLSRSETFMQFAPLSNIPTKWEYCLRKIMYGVSGDAPYFLSVRQNSGSGTNVNNDRKETAVSSAESRRGNIYAGWNGI